MNVTEISYDVIYLSSVTLSIFTVTTFSVLLYVFYKKCINIEPNKDNTKYTLGLFLYVIALFLGSCIVIAIAGKISIFDFPIMFGYVILFITLGVFIYILHTCYIMRIEGDNIF